MHNHNKKEDIKCMLFVNYIFENLNNSKQVMHTWSDLILFTSH